VLTVSDSGIGISDEDGERLFERFFRAGNALERAIPGTGLGLAICKGIVDAHGGGLGVASTLGHGTTVTVSLPLERASSEGDDQDER
jgi:signal transduction histidine kinase